MDFYALTHGQIEVSFPKGFNLFEAEPTEVALENISRASDQSLVRYLLKRRIKYMASGTGTRFVQPAVIVGLFLGVRKDEIEWFPELGTNASRSGGWGIVGPGIQVPLKRFHPLVSPETVFPFLCKKVKPVFAGNRNILLVTGSYFMESFGIKSEKDTIYRIDPRKEIVERVWQMPPE